MEEIPIKKKFIKNHFIVAEFSCAKYEKNLQEGCNLAVSVWPMFVRFLA